MLQRPWYTKRDTSCKVLSDHSIILPPDCLFPCKAQSSFCVMTANVKLDDRLSLLCTGDRFRRWNSLDDQRVCSVCERKFKGRQIEIRRLPGGRYKLYCPTLGCASGPHQWLYSRGSVSEIDEPDWWHVGEQATHHPAEPTPQARCHRL